MNRPDLSVEISSLKLKNPVMPASGTFGIDSCKVININRLGAIIPKSVTKLPRDGNKPPRVCEAVGGMLNSVGIQNKGLEYFIKKVLPKYEEYHTPIIASISAYTIEEFIEMVEALGTEKAVAAIELNISCPNIEAGGKAFGMSSDDTYKIIKKVKSITNKVIIPKLTPNVDDITIIAKAAEEGGADGLSLTNTYIGMAIDINKRKPVLGNIIGGLSGPAIKPMSLRMVWQTSKVVNIPIIGIGGICNWEDAIEYFLAGATAIQVGTASFRNPRTMEEIIIGIEEYMINNGFKSMKEMIGAMGY